MFTVKTLSDIENFISEYFPFYLDDWNKLSPAEKKLLEKNQMTLTASGENDYSYSNGLREISKLATGLECFPVCKDRYFVCEHSASFGFLNWYKIKFQNSTNQIGREGYKILKLMENNPRALTVFYIWIAFNYRVVYIPKEELFNKAMETQKEKTVDIGKGLRMEEYYLEIDRYFDEHPLKHISYRFIKEGKNYLELSCIAKDTSYKINILRSDMKYVIPMIKHVDENWFELMNNAFLNEARIIMESKKVEDKSNIRNDLRGSLYYGI